MSTPADILSRVADYYSAKVSEHGPTAHGADWNSTESQDLRFKQLLSICDRPQPFSINDYGCGYGALATFLQRRGMLFTYCGFDISAAMVQHARAVVAPIPGCHVVDDSAQLKPADYTVASGIFNVRPGIPVEQWEAHIDDTLGRIAALSRHGFAFNMLTAFADPDRMRPDLYYADPTRYFLWCRTWSRRVALLHDYPLWEFTILVRLP